MSGFTLGLFKLYEKGYKKISNKLNVLKIIINKDTICRFTNLSGRDPGHKIGSNKSNLRKVCRLIKWILYRNKLNNSTSNIMFSCFIK